ncbi:MAG: molybdopterin-dependent oxidoreductase [Rubrivivax sp.]|nr:molybdopterin-dependent oxidoreductase [Rubrivivax sp.]
MTQTRSTCPYCGVGCGVVIESEGAQITGVRGDPDHPANFGRLCTKGSTLHLTAAAHLQPQVRALHPMKRAVAGAPLQRIDWDTAQDEIADRLAQIIQRDGPDAVGLYLSGQLLTEDYYVFNKLGKGLIGTNNVDTNSRLCMSSAVAGYKASLGADAPPACYEDLALARTVFITGSNTAWAHPVLYRRLEEARRAQPAQRWIVVDPRRTETAADADLHLQILPGTDVLLHHAMAHLMLWEGLVDSAFLAAHVSGLDALRERVREISPAQAARSCGIREADLVQAARWFAGLDGADPGHSGSGTNGSRQPTLSLYCQGLNQSSSGTDKNRTLINLHLLTGQIGRPGAGPFSLTGQPNAMGGREVGGLANLLSAHRDMSNPAHRAEVAALWGVREVPSVPGRTAVDLFEAAADGQVKALWIACTNPLHSLPHSARVRQALQRAELVIVQDAYRSTATAELAHYLLPATTWGEKSGTVTNSERCISRVRRAVAPVGEARDDWRIAAEVALRLEARLPSRRSAGLEATSMFAYPDAEAVWNEHRESTRGRDLDITGLSYAQLDEAPAQWPFPEGALQGRARLYADGRFATPDGRAQLAAPAWRALAEPRDARYPVSLSTGRLRDQWHGMSRSGTLGRLFEHSAEPVLELHPQELQRRHWQDGELVRVQSRRGEQILPVKAQASVAPAQAFVAMHWGPEWISGGGVNTLMPQAVCPQSKQPELKHAAVRLEPAGLPWQIVAAAWLPAEQAWLLHQALRAQFGAHAFASCVPFGRETAEDLPQPLGLLFRAARAQAPAPAELAATLQPLIEALDLVGPGVLRYADARAGQSRSMRLDAQGRLQGFLLAGDAAAQGWVLELLRAGAPAAAFGRALLAAGRQPPGPVAPRSPQVCACHDVSQARILDTLDTCAGTPADRLGILQQQLKCGTQCGSCLPAVKELIRSHPLSAAAGLPAAAPTEA